MTHSCWLVADGFVRGVVKARKILNRRGRGERPQRSQSGTFERFLPTSIRVPGFFLRADD